MCPIARTYTRFSFGRKDSLTADIEPDVQSISGLCFFSRRISTSACFVVTSEHKCDKELKPDLVMTCFGLCFVALCHQSWQLTGWFSFLHTVWYEICFHFLPPEKAWYMEKRAWGSRTAAVRAPHATNTCSFRHERNKNTSEWESLILLLWYLHCGNDR